MARRPRMRTSSATVSLKSIVQRRQASSDQRSGPGGPGGPSTSYSTMTIGGTITATAVLMILLVGSAAYGWSLVTPTQPVVNSVTGAVTYPMPSFPV